MHSISPVDYQDFVLQQDLEANELFGAQALATVRLFPLPFVIFCLFDFFSFLTFAVYLVGERPFSRGDSSSQGLEGWPRGCEQEAGGGQPKNRGP